MKPRFIIAIAFAALFACACATHAQYPIDLSVPPPPPPAEPVFDPLRAEKSMEVGMFYMKKLNYDAAIERFQDAAKYKPNFARPFLMMGEAYEKKGAKAQAVGAYEQYLKILPHAPDGDRVRKRIARLNEEIQKGSAGKSG